MSPQSDHPGASGSKIMLEMPVSTFVLSLFIAVLLVLSYMLLRDFFVPLAWAAILAYVAWPLQSRLRHLLGHRNNLAALLMTLLVAVVLIVPMLAVVVSLGDELANATREAHTRITTNPPEIPGVLANLPWIGEHLQKLTVPLSDIPAWVTGVLSEHGSELLGEARQVVSAVGRNTFKLAIALIALFFLLRDGDKLVSDMKLILRYLLGLRSEDYWVAVSDTTRGVVYGLVLTALAQGGLAGLGYWAVGIDIPVLLGALTVVLALIPFGAVLVWGSAGLWLLVSGEVWAGTGLLLWGALVVSMVDNVIRPLVISSAARIPFFLVLLGVLGGLKAFGLIGLFLGPIVLNIMLAVWREWLEDVTERV